jgi:hypothetical protein
MRPLAREDFAGTEGSAYRLELGDEQIELVLDTVEELPPSPREGGSFRLAFRGPAEPLLEQATYSLQRGDASFEIFIVPSGQDAAGTWYEATFF